MGMKLMHAKYFPNFCSLSMNRLGVLPRGFGAFPVLEVLDLTYNNLDESNLPGNFFMMGKAVFLFLMFMYERENFWDQSVPCLSAIVMNFKRYKGYVSMLEFGTYLRWWRYIMNSLESEVCLLYCC